MHVLTPTIFDLLNRQIEAVGKSSGVTLSAALAELAKREQYLALEKQDWRYDVGVKYGLLTAQLALALSGQDRDEVLSKLLELLAMRELGGTGR
jgi:UTP--glucose-1-phosphate uridylyltransferase